MLCQNDEDGAEPETEAEDVDTGDPEPEGDNNENIGEMWIITSIPEIIIIHYVAKITWTPLFFITLFNFLMTPALHAQL